MLTYLRLQFTASSYLKTIEINRAEASASMFIQTAVFYGNYPDGFHRIGIFAG
jgi:hypothetical protein